MPAIAFPYCTHCQHCTIESMDKLKKTAFQPLLQNAKCITSDRKLYLLINIFMERGRIA